MPNHSRRTRAVLDPSLDKPLTALQAAITGDALIKAAFALLQRAVTCELVGIFLRIETRPDGPIPFRFVDSIGRKFEREMREGIFFQEHPASAILMANPGIRLIGTRNILPPDEILYASRFYREVMQVMGFRHAIGMYFWDDPPQMPEAVLSVCRIEGQPDFTDDDVAMLDRLYPQIDAALRRMRAIERERGARGELHGLIDPARLACVLHWDLTVAEANRAAREMCAQWNLGAASAQLKLPPFCLPAPLRDACAELKRNWHASVADHPEAGKAEHLVVQHPEGALTANVSLRVRHTAPLGKPSFLIEFDPPKKAASVADRPSRKLSLDRFTLGERELIRLTCAGKSNQEIANETGKALGSVKNALSALYGKTGVHSRSALIALVGGQLHTLAVLLFATWSDVSELCCFGS